MHAKVWRICRVTAKVFARVNLYTLVWQNHARRGRDIRQSPSRVRSVFLLIYECSTSRWNHTVHAQLLPSPQQQTFRERNMWVWLGSLSVAINLLKRYHDFKVSLPTNLSTWLNGGEHWILDILQLTFCEVNKALFFTENYTSVLILNFTLWSMRGSIFDGYWDRFCPKNPTWNGAQTWQTDHTVMHMPSVFFCVCFPGLLKAKDWLLYSSLLSSLALGLALEMEI